MRLQTGSAGSCDVPRSLRAAHGKSRACGEGQLTGLIANPRDRPRGAGHQVDDIRSEPLTEFATSDPRVPPQSVRYASDRARRNASLLELGASPVVADHCWSVVTWWRRESSWVRRPSSVAAPLRDNPSRRQLAVSRRAHPLGVCTPPPAARSPSSAPS